MVCSSCEQKSNPPVYAPAPYKETAEDLAMKEMIRKKKEEAPKKIMAEMKQMMVSIKQVSPRGGICHSRHSRRECKIFASGVNFSRNNAVCYINESKKLHFILISSLKLLTYY